MPKRVNQKFPIVFLVGSSKQKDDFLRYARDLALKGYCVLHTNVFLATEKENYNEEDDTKKMLEQIGFQRVEMANILGIIRKPDGDIGYHTLKEIHLAKKLGKRTIFIEDLLQSKKRIWK